MEKLKDYIKRVEIEKIAAEMVRIPSYSFMEDQEKEIASYIQDFFEREGIESEMTEIRPGRYNVLAKLTGTGGGKSLVLSGHIDTVPPYDMEDAFSGRIEGGKLYGRGAVDMKGADCAMMIALAAIKRSGLPHSGDIYFAGVADEEEQGRGTEYLIDHWPEADAFVVGEPTEMKVCLGHKGLEWIDVDIMGKKVHGGHKDEGVNAIQMAALFIHHIYENYVPVLNQREYPVLGTPTINVGKITGGDQPSTVPDVCRIRLDRRCVPTETIEQVYDELEKIACDIRKTHPEFRAVIRDTFEGQNLLRHEPFLLDEKADVVRSIRTALDIAGSAYEISAFPAWSDAGFVRGYTKSDCLIMGPGRLEVAHSAEEYIEIDDILKAAFVYGAMALDYSK